MDGVKGTKLDADVSSHKEIDIPNRTEYLENEELQGECFADNDVLRGSGSSSSPDYDDVGADESTVYYDASHGADWHVPHLAEDAAESSTGVHDNDDALSKYSSDTLSTIRSKRSRDEEDEEEALYASPPGSPGTSGEPRRRIQMLIPCDPDFKRARVL